MTKTTTSEERTASFGQNRTPNVIDHFGIWLSSVAVRRNANFGGARMADIGCGFEAGFSRSQLGKVSSALLLDVALADDLKANPKITAIEGSIPEVLPTIPSASFDITVCLSVLEHLWDPETAARELHRVTAPGGVVLLNVPTWLGKRALEFLAFRLGWAPAEEMDDHKWYFDPDDLWLMLVRAGFRPSEIHCYRHKFGMSTFAACRISATGEGAPGA
jgi:SAM-dependent methyltransferase